MLRFLADEDFSGKILRGVFRREPRLDIVRVQDVGLLSAHDRDVLDWAAREGRVVLTRDVSTMTGYAFERVEQGLELPGVFVVRRYAPIGRVIDDIFVLAECSLEDE